ncbi:ATP-binding cassette domain-containing protein [Leuconostoc sp.]
MITANHLTFNFTTEALLFENVNFKLSPKQRVALIGDNGSGKSTLLNLLMKNLMPTNGTIQSDGYTLLVPQFYDDNTQNSPGESQRQRLQHAFSQRPDILLLDEPPSNLDQTGIQYLVNQLKRFKGIAVVVSHDAAFLAKIATAVLVIDQKNIAFYPTDFATFQQLQANKIQQQYAQYEVVRKQKQQQLASLARMQEKATHAKKAKKVSNSEKKAIGLAGRKDKVQNGLEKKVKKIRADIQQTAHGKPFEKMGLKLLTTYQQPKKIMQNVTLDRLIRDDFVLINNPINLRLQSGKVIAILGANGAGKSTLLNAIFHDVTQKRYRVNYFHQNIQSQFNAGQPLLPQLQAMSGMNLQVIRDVCGALGIRSDILSRFPNTLSGGQLLKVQLALNLMMPFDILLLDEPTNYLDYDGVLALTNFINDSQAAIVLVSHDETFVKQTATQSFIIQDQNWIDYLTYDDYFDVNVTN